MSAGFFPKREKLDLTELWSGLITASHILHRHDILDAYGHISVRNPDNHKTFYLPRKRAPALLSKASDILEYKTEDGSPVESSTKPEDSFTERFIHSEIYKKFPTINCVIHSHARAVLPYTITDIPLKATIHTAGFLGTSVPVWDIASTYSTFSSSDAQDLLVRDTNTAHALAAEFKPSTSASFIFSQVRSALPSIGGKPSESATVPSHPVVLMRGHGFTTCAEGVEDAVFQAIYTKENALVQSAALANWGAVQGGKIQGKVDVEGGGKIKDAKIELAGGVHGLSEKEVGDATKMNRETVMRPWELWCREVQVSPLYVNECVSED